MPFRSLGLDSRVLTAVDQAGYTVPTPIQAAAIPLIRAGHDVIGIAQTGTGKTAAFALPILTRLAASPGACPGRQPGARALILAPTRELAAQIEESIRASAAHLPLRTAAVFGGVGERAQIDALRAGTEIIVATPGRLLDLAGRGCARFEGLECLVLDEADRMLDMGFLPDIRRIIRSLPRNRQTLLFSATLSREIESVANEFLRTPKIVQIGRRANPADTVSQIAYDIPKQLKPALLARLLRDPALSTVLVFCRMKHAADRLARTLEHMGVRTAALHSNRSQNQRIRALSDFKNGDVRVLVATDIAARGIDVDGISHVVNFDFPMHPEDYVHRVGRTGRALATGDAISFVTPEDHTALRAVERLINRTIPRKKAEDLAGLAASSPAAPPVSARHAGRPQTSARHSSPHHSSARPAPRPSSPNRQDSRPQAPARPSARPQAFSGQPSRPQASRPQSARPPAPPRKDHSQPPSIPHWDLPGSGSNSNLRPSPSSNSRSHSRPRPSSSGASRPTRTFPSQATGQGVAARYRSM